MGDNKHIMEWIVFGVLFIAAVYMTYRNVILIKRMKKVKKYSPMSNKVFSDEKEAFEDVKNYLVNEKDDEFLNKARILATAVAINLKKDYSEYLNEFNLENLVLKNGKASKKIADLNSDSFFWFIMAIFNAKDNKEALIKLKNKIEDVDALKNYIYYDMSLNLIEVFETDNPTNFEFFNNVIKGNYSKYKYDKHLILLFKRLCIVLLGYYNQPLEDFETKDLIKFSKTMVGKYLMTNLNIYNKYKTNDEDNK